MGRLLVYSILAAILCHGVAAWVQKWRPSGKWVAGTVAGSALANLAFQIGAAVVIGYVDPFLPIALFLGGLYSAFVAGANGIPFYPFYLFYRLRKK